MGGLRPPLFHWAYLSVETKDMCRVESQDICLVETQDMGCVESLDMCFAQNQYKGGGDHQNEAKVMECCFRNRLWHVAVITKISPK